MRPQPHPLLRYGRTRVRASRRLPARKTAGRIRTTRPGSSDAHEVRLWACHRYNFRCGSGTAWPTPPRRSSTTTRTASSPASFCADSAPRPPPWGRTSSATDGCTRWNKPLHSRQRTASTANGRNSPQSRSEYVVGMLTAPSRGRVAEPGSCHTRIICRVRRSRMASRQGPKSGPKPLVNQAECE